MPVTSDPLATTGLGWPVTLAEAMGAEAILDADVSRETSTEVPTGLGWPT